MSINYERAMKAMQQNHIKDTGVYYRVSVTGKADQVIRGAHAALKAADVRPSDYYDFKGIRDRLICYGSITLKEYDDEFKPVTIRIEEF